MRTEWRADGQQAKQVLETAVGICQDKGLWRRKLQVSVAIFFLLAGCGSKPKSEYKVDIAKTLADEEAELAMNRTCIIKVLNNTVYKPQGDDQLESALFNQNIDNCGEKFQKAFVKMRQAARDYRVVAIEIMEKTGKENIPISNNNPNLLCSLLPGESCPSSLPQDWDIVDLALRQRAKQAKTVMDTSQIDLLVTAGNGYDVWGQLTPSGELKAGIEIAS